MSALQCEQAAPSPPKCAPLWPSPSPAAAPSPRTCTALLCSTARAAAGNRTCVAAWGGAWPAGLSSVHLSN